MKLWELWEERPDEPGVEAQFHALHYQTIERLRGKGKKSAIDDKLLYILIRRFIDAYAISVIEPLKHNQVRDVISSMAAFAPEGSTSPVLDRLWSSGIKVYKVMMGAHESFLALNVKISETKNAGVACPAIFFRQGSLILMRGVYLFAYGQALLREDTEDKTAFWMLRCRRTRFGKQILLSIDVHAYRPWAFDYPEPWDSCQLWGPARCEPCEDEPVRAIAKRLFEEFDT